MKLRTAILAGALGVAGITTALAHGGATGIVKERMDAMKAMGEAVKSLSGMMRGETEYDPSQVRADAETIESHAGDALTSLFPEGSTDEPSEAKPEIWSDWEAFEDQANRLQAMASGLSAAADNGLMMEQDGSTSSMMGTSNSGMMGGGSSMMSGNPMMGGSADVPSGSELASMPADGVFHMVAQTCSSCHTRFRAEDD